MKCSKCGTELEPGELFCGECGWSVGPVSEKVQGIAPTVASAAQSRRAAPGMWGLLVLVVLVTSLLVLIAGGIVAWIWFRDDLRQTAQSNSQSEKNRNQPKDNENTNISSPTPLTKTNSVTSNEDDNNPDTGWTPRNERASINGENLTHYRGTTPEQCQEDCASNASCKAFTFIRAGAYNPGDPPMCYLISVVTQTVPHDCCISAAKQ
jgi:hypothetical protein